MKILVTGSGGRVGRAIHIRLMRDHDVVGFDRVPCSTAAFVGDIRDESLLVKALDEIEAVVHVAALHAPHVDMFSDDEFLGINVRATERFATLAAMRGVKHFVFTSTTALYGYASTPPGRAGWIVESVKPEPKTIYHRSKIEAEAALETVSSECDMAVTVLQMSRCFPERADLMALYRLTRGIDYRDVANAHACAIDGRIPGFSRFIISGDTPFTEPDCELLYKNAPQLFASKVPDLVHSFEQRGWTLPMSLDRVYSSQAAQDALGWTPKYGWQTVLELLDSDFAEVLPVPKVGS